MRDLIHCCVKSLMLNLVLCSIHEVLSLFISVHLSILFNKREIQKQPLIKIRCKSESFA